MAGGAGFTLGRLAEALDATLDAHPERVVKGVAPLATATPTELSFIVDRRHLEAARASRAGAFLAPIGMRGLPGPTLECRDPRQALVDALTLFHPPGPPVSGVDASARVALDACVDATASVGAFAVVESGATIGPRVRIDPFVYVGPGAEIGGDSVLYPHVVVYGGTKLGRRVVIHAGVVIGADGFGFIRGPDGHRKIPQVGIVVVADDVEIGANSTIDRATLGQTVIGRGVKIDNLVQIGHNVEVGERTLMAAQVGIGGSSRIGRDVVLGGQVGVGDHVEVGDGAMLGGQTGVLQDVGAGSRLFGTWGRPLRIARRIWLAQERLPDVLRSLKRIEERLAALETQAKEGDGRPQ